jgi:hypothetical protein
MKFSKIVLTVVLPAMVVLVVGATPFVLSSISLETISPYSPIVLILDSEITHVPVPEGAELISYRSEPVDGNKKSLTAARYRLKNASCDCEPLRQYLMSAGYAAIDENEYSREDDSVSLSIEDNLLIVAKYSWY